MNRTDDLRSLYQELRDDDEDEFWEPMGKAVNAELEKLAAGRLVEHFFDGRPTVLDVLFLAGVWEGEVKYAIANQIGKAFEEGHSWNEAALGVSRQAAVKRFGELVGGSAYQRALAGGQSVPSRASAESLPTALDR